MNIKIDSRALKGVELSANYIKHENSKGAVLLSHNSSGDVDNPLIFSAQNILEILGYSSLAYNFHYVNGIGVEAATWEDIEKDVIAAFEKLQELEPNKKIYAVGKSLGGAASVFAAYRFKDAIDAVGIFGLPKLLFDECKVTQMLSEIECPIYVSHGTKDRFGTPEEIEEYLEKSDTKKFTIQPIDGATHSFEKEFEVQEVNKIITQMFEKMFDSD